MPAHEEPLVQTGNEQGEEPTPWKGTGLVPSVPRALFRAGEAVPELLIPSPGTCLWLVLLLSSPVEDFSPQQDISGSSSADTVGFAVCWGVIFTLPFLAVFFNLK